MSEYAQLVASAGTGPLTQPLQEVDRNVSTVSDLALTKQTESQDGVTPLGQESAGLDVNCQENHETSAEPQTSIDIVINNVVCTFATRCHLNLRKIATEGTNVIYRRESGMVSMKLRKPYTTASIWSSGKITCTGATSEQEALIAARRISRTLQTLGFRVRFTAFRVVNVLGTCAFPFGIRITQFSRDHPESSSYEPELHPGVTYRIKSPKATLKIFSTGSITVTAPSVMNVQLAIEHIFPLVANYQMDLRERRQPAPPSNRLHLMPSNRGGPRRAQKRKRGYNVDGSDEADSGDSSDEEDEYFDSDESQD